MLGTALAAITTLACAWALMLWGILPRIDAWRPWLEAEASQALGLPVRLGAIRLRSQPGWRQVLEVDGLRIVDAAGVEALSLPRLEASLTPASLLHWPPRPERIDLQGLALRLRRDVEGRIWWGGLPGPAPGQAGQGPPAWLRPLLELPALSVRGGRLSWVDEAATAGPLQLEDATLELGRSLRQHRLQLAFQAPEALGGAVRLDLRWTRLLRPLPDPESAAGPAIADWRGWQGHAELQFGDVDLAALVRHRLAPPGLPAGRVGGRLALDFDRGRLLALRAGLEAPELQAELGPWKLPLPLRDVVVRGVLTLDGRDGALELEALQASLPQGPTGPVGPVSLRWRRPPGAAEPAWAPWTGPIESGVLKAAQFKLDTVTELLARLPGGGPPALAAWQAVAPRGQVVQLGWRWEGPLAAPRSLGLEAELRGLQLAAAPLPSDPLGRAELAEGHWLGRPGVQGLDAELRLDGQGQGEAVLSLKQGMLELPGVFAAPRLELTQLAARLDWHREAGSWRWRARDLRLQTPDWQGRFEGRWHRPEGQVGSGHLELDGRIERIALDRIGRHLPLLLSPELRRYLEQALLGGRAEQLRLRLAGPLAAFPFVDAEGRPQGGEFRVSAQLRQARFDYLPWDLPGDPAAGEAERLRWPAAEALDAELQVEGRSLRIRQGRASLADRGLAAVQLPELQAEIQPLGPKAVLRLDTLIRGPGTEILRLVRQTPLDRWLGGALRPFAVEGELGVRVGLAVPLADTQRARAEGEVILAGSTLQPAPGWPRLGPLQGRVAFTEQGFRLDGVAAPALGGELQAEGGMAPGSPVRLQIQGRSSAEGLRRTLELPAWAQALAAHADGTVAWQASLASGPAGLEWELSSPLQGLALTLPPPFDKAAAASWPLRLRRSPLPAGPGLAPQDRLALDLGPAGAPPRLQLRLVRASGPDGSLRVLSHALGVGRPAPEPEPRGVARIQVDSLSVEAWQALRMAVAGGAAASAAAPARPAAGAARPGAPVDPGLPWPADVELRAGELALGGRRLKAVTLQLQQPEAGAARGEWAARIEAEQARGSLDWRPQEGPQGHLRARFDRLVLPPAEARAVGELLDGSSQAEGPARRPLPAVDLVAEDFVLRGRPLGRLVIEAAPQGTGWRLDRLTLATPEARFEAHGAWQGGAGGGRTELGVDLDVDDAGALLARFGQAGALRGGRGELKGRLGWRGSPLDLDAASLDGTLQLGLGRGQFLRAEPGVSRLLGVLSLQSLPRRLLLDFRDVFAEGFSFDRLEADIALAQGLARTRNFRIQGPQALVLTEGEADLGAETQRLQVWVVPEFNAGAAALAYAAVNPAVGLGSFIAQWLLSRPLSEAGTRAFRITGGWADPQVERLDQVPPRPGEPAASEPAAASRSPPRP